MEQERFSADEKAQSHQDDEHSPPSSVEMKPVKVQDHAHPRSDSPAPAGAPTPKDKDEGGSGKQTPKQKKKKLKINKDMIKRVEGGGVGMVNPMGWYDYSPSHKPGRMGFIDMRPGGANAP